MGLRKTCIIVTQQNRILTGAVSLGHWRLAPNNLSRLYLIRKILCMFTKARMLTRTRSTTLNHMFTNALFRNYVPSKRVLWRNFTSHPYLPGHAFAFFPQFFSRREQRLLLSASLKILDSSDTRLSRRTRAAFFKSKLSQSNDTDPMELFAPDDLYHFQDVSLKNTLYIF